jgi:hypothetical protein
MNAYRRSRGIAALILNLGTKWTYRRKKIPVPDEQEAGWEPEPVWTVLEKQKMSYPCRNLNLVPSSP